MGALVTTLHMLWSDRYKSRNAGMWKLEGTSQKEQSSLSVSTSRNAGRRTRPSFALSVSSYPGSHQSHKEQRQVGVKGRTRVLEVRRIRTGRDQLASHRTGEVEGWSREDLISCYMWGSVRMWWEQGVKGDSFRTPIHSDGTEGSSHWYLYRSSDDRSGSWGLESVMWHYSNQGYETKRATMGQWT